MNNRSTLPASLFVMAAALTVQQTTWAGNSPLKKILDDWRDRQRIAQSILYEAKGTKITPKGAFTDHMHLIAPGTKGEVPIKDHTSPLRLKWLIDFNTNCVRHELSTDTFHFDMKKFAPNHRITFFDGNALKILEPRETNTSSQYVPSKAQPDLWVQQDAIIGAVLKAVDMPVVMSHGHVPTQKASPRPGALKMSYQINDFFYKGKGQLDGAQCEIIRTRSAADDYYHEFWVDPKRKSAILKLMTFSRGFVRNQTTIRYVKNGDSWFASNWTTLSYLRGKENRNRLVFSKEVNVVNSQFNLKTSTEDFQPPTKPGMVVRDSKSQKYFLVNDEGELEEVTQSELMSSGVTNWRWTYFAAGFVLLVFVAALGYYFFRKKRKNRIQIS